MEFGLKESCDGIPDVLRKERYLTIRGLHVLGCDEEVWLWQRRGGFDEQGHVVRHCHGDFLQPVRDVVVKTRAMIINSAEFLAPVTRLSLLESKARDDLKVTAVTSWICLRVNAGPIVPAWTSLAIFSQIAYCNSRDDF